MDPEVQPLQGRKGLTSLTDKAVRHGFITKVYGILSAQLGCTTVLGGLVMVYGEPLLKTNPSMVMFCLFASFAVSVGMMCIFMCNPSLMRQSPINYVILFVFTLAKSVMVGFICIQYTKESVLIVTGVTAFVVLGLSLFACQTSYDFSGMGPYLMCAVMVLMGMGFCLWIGSMLGMAGSPAFKAVHMLYAGLGALIFSFYIVYDTQLIIGGKHANQFSIDDYCMAAISLYMDIIQLFLFLLQLLGQRK
jgi:hypothetical protein